MPTKKQATLIDKHINCCRFVYNLALETKQTAYAGNRVVLSCFDLMAQLPDLKKECPWLVGINAQSLQQSIVHMDIAFTKFFKGQAKFPKFKSKKARQSFKIPQDIKLNESLLIIPKFREGIKTVEHRKLQGNIKQCTIIKTPTGKYFVSIATENNKQIPEKKEVKESTTIGIDLGLTHFLITSNGEKFDNPRFLKKSLSKLKFIQRRQNKYKGTRRFKKLRIIHEKVANQRHDFLHKVSALLINNHESICMEDLYINNMRRNHNVSQSIIDASWGMFTTQLEYKAGWNGKNIIKIGQFDPSTKTCSTCGYINKKLKLYNRSWKCPKCQTGHDRDINAAINIKNFGLKNNLSMGDRHENQKELPTLVGALTSEGLL